MLTVKQFHDQWFRDNYDIVPKASRIRTRDSTLFGRDRIMRDETLTPMTSGKTISLAGTYPAGAGGEPQLKEKLAPVRDFVRGFITGNIVGSEDPGTMISLGRVFLPQVQDEELRGSLSRALDEAQEEWEKVSGARAAKDGELGTTFTPHTQEAEVSRYWKPGDGPRMKGINPTADAGPSSLLARARKHTEDFVLGLPGKRAALTAPAKAPAVAKAKCSPAEFEALRRAKGAA